MQMDVGSVAKWLMALLLLPYPMWQVVLSGAPITAHWQDVSQVQACGSGVEPGPAVACWIPTYNEGRAEGGSVPPRLAGSPSREVRCS